MAKKIVKKVVAKKSKSIKKTASATSVNTSANAASATPMQQEDRRPIPDASIAIQEAAESVRVNVQAVSAEAYKTIGKIREMLCQVQEGWLWKLLTVGNRIDAVREIKDLGEELESALFSKTNDVE